MKILFGYLIAVLIVLMLFFGVLAARHIDRSKTGAMSKRSIWLTAGPLVPEEILTPVGQKWALFRNVCALIAFGAVTIYAIIMAVSGEWH